MDDIAPPTAPQVQKVEEQLKEEKKGERKGFLTKIFSKKDISDSSVDDDIDKLRRDLGIITEKVPSIREQFEKQVAQEYNLKEDDIIPSPPPETLEEQTQFHERDAIEQDSKLFSTPVEEQKEEQSLNSFNVDDLEKKLETIGKSSEEKTVDFFVTKGKKAQTLEEFQQAVDKLSVAEFKKRQLNGDLALWVRTTLLDEGLATDISQLDDKKRIIELLDAELGHLPQKKNTAKKQAIVIHKDVEIHFDKLTTEHREAMEKLESVVMSRKSDDLSKRQLKNHFILENNKLVESLRDLVRAVELIDDATYKKAVTGNRDEFLEWIKQLVQQAHGAHALNAEKLQSQLAEELKKYARSIELKIASLRQELQDQESLLKQRENVALEEEQQLRNKEDYVKDQEEELTKRKQSLREEIVNYHQEKNTLKREQLIFADEYQKKLKELTKTVLAEKQARARLEKKIQKDKETLSQREKDVKQRELEIPQKIREQALEVIKEREEVKAQKQELRLREEKLIKAEEESKHMREELEQEISAREEQIQRSVNKLMALDEDAKNQRLRAEQLKDELDNQGFKKYLEARLKEIRTGRPFDHAEPKKEARKLYGDLYLKIDECNDAIESKDFSTAKEIYKELKNMFEHQHISESEKDILYDAIRELYTNLQLAMLEE